MEVMAAGGVVELLRLLDHAGCNGSSTWICSHWFCLQLRHLLELKISGVQSRQQLPCVIGQCALLLVKNGCSEPDRLLQPFYLRLARNDRTIPFRAEFKMTEETFLSAEYISFYEQYNYTGTIKTAQGRAKEHMEKGSVSEEGYRTHRESSLPSYAGDPFLGGWS